MNPTKFSSREKNFALIFILVCLIYCVYFVFKKIDIIDPRMIETEIANVNKQLARNMRIIRKAENLEQQFKGDLELFAQKSADEQIMSETLSQLETAAKGLDAKIIKIKPQMVKKKDLYNDFSVDLSMDGQLAEVMLFIHILQSPEHNLMIHKLSIEKSNTTAQAVLARIVVSRIMISRKEMSGLDGKI